MEKDPNLKRMAIGDIHGKKNWKDYLKEDFTEFYFVGDYFDNYEETPAVSQIRNFLAIVKEARRDPRIRLCCGNHDYQYLRGLDRSEKYSGFQNYAYMDIQIALESSMDIIKPVYVTEDNIIISHAGVTKTFLRDCSLENPEDINNRFIEYRMSLAFNGFNPYGDDPRNGPLWVRPDSLIKDKLEGYKQIVGHTKMEKITTIEGITFIDLDTCQEVYWF